MSIFYNGQSRVIKIKTGCKEIGAKKRKERENIALISSNSHRDSQDHRKKNSKESSF